MSTIDHRGIYRLSLRPGGASRSIEAQLGEHSVECRYLALTYEGREAVTHVSLVESLAAWGAWSAASKRAALIRSAYTSRSKGGPRFLLIAPTVPFVSFAVVIAVRYLACCRSPPPALRCRRHSPPLPLIGDRLESFQPGVPSENLNRMTEFGVVVSDLRNAIIS